jgi:hypothetical protein
LVERLDQTQTALDIPVDLKSLQMDAGFKARRAGKRRRHVSNKAIRRCLILGLHGEAHTNRIVSNLGRFGFYAALTNLQSFR